MAIRAKECSQSIGSGAWIRTREMSVPKTDALPLGYARIVKLTIGTFTLWFSKTTAIALALTCVFYQIIYRKSILESSRLALQQRTVAILSAEGVFPNLQRLWFSDSFFVADVTVVTVVAGYCWRIPVKKWTKDKRFAKIDGRRRS